MRYNPLTIPQITTRSGRIIGLMLILLFAAGTNLNARGAQPSTAAAVLALPDATPSIVDAALARPEAIPPGAVEDDWPVYTDPQGEISFRYPPDALLDAGQNPTDLAKNITLQFNLPDSPYQGMSLRIEPNPHRLSADAIAVRLYRESSGGSAAADPESPEASPAVAHEFFVEKIQINGVPGGLFSIPATNTELTAILPLAEEVLIAAPVHAQATTQVAPEALELFYLVLNSVQFAPENPSTSPDGLPAGLLTAPQAVPLAQAFSLPLGFRDWVSYGPRVNYSGVKVIENSAYGVKNPDMIGITCFGVDWGSIYHAGADWYRADGQTTAQAEVTAMADGIVMYINYNFPGGILLIEHSLPPDGVKKIYSVYGHLNSNSLSVSKNQVVTRGQRLGTVLKQYYDGRYTPYHDDSHLHFEMRYFYNASNIYTQANCNGYLPGRGYTYPQHPDNFPPALSAHYTDPVGYLVSKFTAWLPLVRKSGR